MARFLHYLYGSAGILAGIFLMLIGVLVTIQIVARLFGELVPSADDFAGYCLAATTFLGLAYSFREGAHIRVTLFVGRLKGRAGQLSAFLALAIAAAMVVYLAYYTVLMVYDSWRFEEMTTGLVALPLWIPQLFMAIGMCLFAFAILEDLMRVAIGHVPYYSTNETAEKVESDGSDNN